MQNNRSKNILQLHFIVFIFGFTSVLGALISISALPITIYRMGIASFFLALFIFFHNKNKFKLRKGLIIKILICGLIIALHWITFFYAIKISNVSITVSMMSSAAFLTSLIEAGIWNVTSFSELRRDAEETERWNLLHSDKTPKKSHLEKCLSKNNVPTVAVSDYVKMVSEQIGPYVPGNFYALGTD